MLNRNYIRRNITTVAIVIFIAIYVVIVGIKPGFMYNKDGSLRQFGIGYNTRTVLPIWLIVIIISIVSYFSVLYYLAMPRLDY